MRMARLLLHATVPHASCVCPSHHVASPWPPEACASGGGFAVGGFLWKPSSVFGFWIVCHCLMTRPTPLLRLQPSTTTIMIVVAALLRTAQCTSSPSSPVPPPPELRHPLQDHLQGPAPPASPDGTPPRRARRTPRTATHPTATSSLSWAWGRWPTVTCYELICQAVELRGIRPMSDRGLQEDLGLRYEGCSGKGGVEIDRQRNQRDQWEANYSQSRALRHEGIKK